MEIRPLEPEEVDSVREIARRSLEASYSHILSPETIETAVSEWYTDEAFEEYLDSDEMTFVVAVEDDAVIGFSQSHVVEEIDKGRILWLHVDPDYRGRGVATELFDVTREVLSDRGIDRVTGLVLAENEEGNRFYDEHGFEKLYERHISIAGEDHTENVYGEPGTEPDELEMWAAPDGEEVYVDWDESTRGSEGLFYTVYSDLDRERRYGFFCSNCASIDTAMDTMGRIVCQECGNRRRPTRWDAAYL